MQLGIKSEQLRGIGLPQKAQAPQKPRWPQIPIDLVGCSHIEKYLPPYPGSYPQLQKEGEVPYDGRHHLAYIAQGDTIPFLNELAVWRLVL
jgi:hypothetical protein